MSKPQFFSQAVLKYIKGFEEGLPILPNGIGALLPYADREVFNLAKQFYTKFYSDEHQRNLILGINPGRLGAGSTGIPFTDAKNLEAYCAIPSPFKTHEPSSVFIYKMIEAFGGVQKFYQSYFISSISPIGFVSLGKNFNYYDDPKLLETLQDYIVLQMHRLLQLDLNRKTVFCMGEGKNFKYLNRLNQTYQWFEQILPLPHPRYIIQYKQKEINQYIERYLNAFNH